MHPRLRRSTMVVLLVVAGQLIGASSASAGQWWDVKTPFWFGSRGTQVVGLTQAQRTAFDAVERDDADEVTEYLRRYGDPRIRNAADQTMLEVAASKGHWRVVQTLLSYPTPTTPEDIRAALAAAERSPTEGATKARTEALLRLRLPIDRE